MPTPNKQCPQCLHYRDDIEPYDDFSGRHYYCTAVDPPVCIDGYYNHFHICKEAYINAKKSTYTH